MTRCDDVEALVAAEALGAVGPDAADAVTVLAGLARHDDQHVRAAAIASLGLIGKPAAVAIPVIAEALRDDILVYEQARRNAVSALGRIGSPAREAIPALVATALDTRIDLRREALAAVIQIALDLLAKNDTLGIGHLESSEIQFRGMGFSDSDVAPLRDAVRGLRDTRDRWWVYATGISGSLLGVVALTWAASVRVWRWFLIRLCGHRWQFVAGVCEYTVVAEPRVEGGGVRLTPKSADSGLTVEGLIVLEDGSWPPNGPGFHILRERVRGKKVRVEVAEPLFRRPWATAIGGPLRDWQGAAIAGQLCQLDEILDLVRPEIDSVVFFACLGCRDSPANPKLPRLELAGAEVDRVTGQLRHRRAAQLGLPPSARDTGTCADLERALTEADIVHVCAHARPDGVYLDRVMTAEHLTPLLPRIRCRFLVLSACRSGDLASASSFVFPLVRRGVNVLAATTAVNDLACKTFFEAFYRSLLPRRRAVGIEIGQALRDATAACFPPGQSGVRDEVWTPGINSFILYGDPSLQLRLQAREPATGPRHAA